MYAIFNCKALICNDLRPDKVFWLPEIGGERNARNRAGAANESGRTGHATRLELKSTLRRGGPCPIHGGGRAFSVSLTENVFQCFDATCAAKGDVIDRWAAITKQSLRHAASDLVNVFRLEPTSNPGTEKRNGSPYTAPRTPRFPRPLALRAHSPNRVTARHHADEP